MLGVECKGEEGRMESIPISKVDQGGTVNKKR